MSEFQPVARSPIRSIPSTTVLGGWEVSARRSDADLRIMDCTPLSKVLVRAAEDGETACALGVPFGRANRDEQGILVVGAGPGEWLLLGPPGAALEIVRKVETIPNDGLMSVIDTTHSRALIRLSGAQSADLLAKVCGIDLSDDITPDGAAFRSTVAKVVTGVVRDDRDGERSYLLCCERSFGQFLFDALLNAGQEFGIEVEGFGTSEKAEKE